ncbi:carbonic anhydrase-like [Chironomus tepperi]|uniref:carbonic anhydrase-like n=1 Tax=Chironomus tepperi TaxID=113505 RepID=UPI00391F68FE
MKYQVIVSIFLLLSINEIKSKPFERHVELHYQKDHRNLTSETKPFLHFSYEEWTLDGPSKWPGTCNTGHRQSPIAFDLVEPIIKNEIESLRMIGAYDAFPKEVHAINSGHSAAFSFVYKDDEVPQITGGPLHDEVYNFASFHFHYPCEHLAVKYKDRCILELHFVHFNSKYLTIQNATNQPDGLAVVAVLFEEIQWGSSQWLPFLPMLHHVYEPDTDYTERKLIFSYADAMGFTSFPKFISYKGSLTTPACSETVTWIVVDQLFLVAQYDMDKLQQVRDHDGFRIKRNNRPVQPINGRKVYLYDEF